MSTAIWRKQDDEWSPLAPSGFPSEEKLHDLVEGSPHLLPLSGDPTLTILGREVALGSGYADLLAVESDGRPVIIEIKLRRNAEARRAVIAQVLTYAAYLKGLDLVELEAILRPHLSGRNAASIAELTQRGDQSGQFDETGFKLDLEAALDAGAFRLVLVLDEAPKELVQLVGYLESIATAITVDLITVSAYQVGGEEILVPTRVDPEYQPEQPERRSGVGPRPKAPTREADGSELFEQSIARAPAAAQADLRRLLDWAQALETEQLATLRSFQGEERDVLVIWVRGEKGGLVSIWNDKDAYISLWRSVFVRLAPDHIAGIEELIGGSVGQGSTVADISPELLDLLTAAYRDAAKGGPAWNKRDFYVSFGENDQRNWDEAVEWGFVSAGGGEWYSRSLRSLEEGNRVFVYIPKGNGVGGYVGVGTVSGPAVMAKDFRVTRDGLEVPYLDATKSPEAGQHMDDPALAEWIVPVDWIDARSRQDAIKDSDFFANQNSATRLAHGYTVQRLTDEFGLSAG